MVPYLEILQELKSQGFRITIVTEKTTTTWAGAYGYNMAYIPGRVLQPFLDRKQQIFESGSHDELTSRGLELVIREVTIPYYAEMYRFLHQLLSKDQPALVLCDFMAEACADACDTLGIPYALTLSSLLPDPKDPGFLMDIWRANIHADTMEGMGSMDRLYYKVIKPAVGLAKLLPAVFELEALKKDLGVVVPPGSQGPGKPHALKLVNIFFGFEPPRPLDPMVQLVGPISSHINSTMPEELNQWIANLITKPMMEQAAASPAADADATTAPPITVDTAAAAAAAGGGGGGEGGTTPNGSVWGQQQAKPVWGEGAATAATAAALIGGDGHGAENSSCNVQHFIQSQPRVVYVAFGTQVDVPAAVLSEMYQGLVAALEQGLCDLVHL